MLYIPQYNGNLTIAILLLEKSNTELNIIDQASRTPFWLAAYSGHISALNKLFELGVSDVNFQSLERRTPFWEPVVNGYLDIVEWLLSKNADPGIPDNNGVSPLAKAEIKGQILVIEAIRKHQSISKDGKSRLIPYKRKHSA
jgi:uncharacterized protein